MTLMLDVLVLMLLLISIHSFSFLYSAKGVFQKQLGFLGLFSMTRPSREISGGQGDGMLS